MPCEPRGGGWSGRLVRKGRIPLAAKVVGTAFLAVCLFAWGGPPAQNGQIQGGTTVATSHVRMAIMPPTWR